MTAAMIVILIILAVAMVLFTIDLFPAEVVGLGILVALILTGVLTPEEGFAGFGSETSITILGILILSTALVRTGVIHLITRQILGTAKGSADRVFWIISGITAALSSFMSNTATAAFFSPITVNISKRLKLNPSTLLMPMAFASILASSVTLVATTTNLVVSGLLSAAGLEPIGMFELTPVGLVVVTVGLLYMYFIGRKLIPIRESEELALDEADDRSFRTEAKVPAESSWVGKSLKELALGERFDLTILQVIRENKQPVSARANTKIHAGDRLIMQGSRQILTELTQEKKLVFSGKVDEAEAAAPKQTLAEVLVLPGSRFEGRSLRGLAMRERYGLQVLGIHRRGETLRSRLASTRLRGGDELLIQGSLETIASLAADDTFRVIDGKIDSPVDLPKARITVAVFVLVMIVAALEWVSLPVAVMTGVVALFVSGSITPGQAYRSTSWSAWLLICSMLSLGKAIEVSGLAAYLADIVVTRLQITQPLVLLSVFFGLALLLTQPMSNQAAAVIIVPIAMQTAQRLGFDPRPFAIMIVVGASCSFITPLEPACLMVYGPGNYRFFDFTRVGGLLTLLIFGIALVMVPWLWPL